jgi:pimeloyl-ACP methyl ester carboxylesterase
MTSGERRGLVAAGVPYEPLDVPVEGGQLRVARFGYGPEVAVALHGTSSSAMAWLAVARALPAGWSLLAPDLRGRGRSADLPGPYALRRHVDDLVAVLSALGTGPVPLVGHSLGGYAALLAAADRPDLFSRLILLDAGATPLLPADADLDAINAAVLGPALTRLAQTFPAEEAYVEVFRTHPAMRDAWNEDFDVYARYDITGSEGAFRSRVREEAVRSEGRELLGGAARFDAALRSLAMPALLLTAPAGMFGVPPPFLPPDLVAFVEAEVPALQVEQVPGTNHYTLVMAPPGSDVVARRIVDPSSWPSPPAG